MKCTHCECDDASFSWKSSALRPELNYDLALCDSCCSWALTVLFTHDPLLGYGLNKLLRKQSNTYDKTNT